MSTNDREWIIRGRIMSIREDGPFTLGESPVPPERRSEGYDYAVFDSHDRATWVDTKEECERHVDRWNTHFAFYLMVKGTKAEGATAPRPMSDYEFEQYAKRQSR